VAYYLNYKSLLTKFVRVVNNLWKNILFLMLLSIEKMHGKGVIIALGLVLFMADAVSQELSHQVLVPAAGVTAGGGYNYSQTIGETAVEIKSTEDFTITQGFQQPRITFVIGPPPPGTGVKIGPNPASEYLYVYLWGEESRTFRISIININGTAVYSEEFKFYDNFYNREEISVSSLVTGLYFVKVMSKDGVINQSFKLEKF
jgi:hypothetical protein